MKRTVMVYSPETGCFPYALRRDVPLPEGLGSLGSLGVPLVTLAGVSEACFKGRILCHSVFLPT